MLVPVPAMAQDSGESCAAIADDRARLACYDGIFRPAGAAIDASAVVIESERLIPANPNGRRPAEMEVACAQGALTVQFRFAGQLVSATGDIVAVTFQVDQGPTLVRSLVASEDNATAGIWTTSESNAFLNSLTGGSNLKVRMQPVRQRSLTVDFRFGEHQEEIAAVRAACGS